MDLLLTKASLESGDRARLGEVARDLGRHLAAHSEQSWLTAVRRLAAKLRPARTSEYERGFLEAIELVTTGFARQVEDDTADEIELLKIQSHPTWLPTLRFIFEGVSRPSDLAKRLDVSAGRVTKIVDELEDADLVTQMAEGKERPCRLTPRARVLLQRLPSPAAATVTAAAVAKAVDEVVPAVVSCMSALTRDRRIGRERLLETMRGALTVNPAARIFELLGASLRETSWATMDDSDDTWVATDTELLVRLQQHLSLACQGRRVPLLDWLALLSERGDVVLRVGGGLLEWDSAVGSLARVEVLRDDELRYGPSRIAAGGQQVVYESPSLLAADRRHGWMKHVIDGARARYCLGVSNSPPIPHFVPYKIEVPEYAP